MILEISKKRLEKADEIAIYNGFTYTEVPCLNSSKNLFLHPKEKIQVIQNCKKKHDIKQSEPVMLYYNQHILVNKSEQLKQKTNKNLGLDIIGISNGVAEAMLINTAVRILKEEGYKNIFVNINSIGDKQSISKFLDEFSTYCNKNFSDLEARCKKAINRKNFNILSCEHEKCTAVISNAPKPINFLSEDSQNHFREVLEYLDEMRIDYRIKDNLISHDNHYSKTIFEIRMEENDSTIGETLLARGGRYDEAVNKIANKRNLVAVGMSMQFKKNSNIKAESNRINESQIFLIQFGFIAKLKSFEIIDTLRQHRILIKQSLHREKLSDQFDEAKKNKTPFILILGQKEALDNEVIFRDVVGAYQDVIKIDLLPRYLKKKGFIQ
ncbi:hypothetical protein A2442_03505 [Candidatus Campbellbacteria bacterium RIFOXYC2_FULL_35_25]|uniref:Histidyl-tRNA synthetase n=1 Tax=Candidatus Campbellbacteria bacterium RIFOXYC2_FULL_35_25 TaxID=1797582 RepID=A0A1F5EHM7_9BACT|nr:MAG: hypothetical protein A2442_03505 [Candidatus Campbellbacteria bacterium RIFOXYC2_FULL_35_25]